MFVWARNILLVASFSGAVFKAFSPCFSLESARESEKLLLEKHLTTKDLSFTHFWVPIQINNQKQLLNTYKITKIKEAKDKPPLVLIHGWSSGLGLWSKNIEDLADHFDLYVFDTLGFGLSSRPDFVQLANERRGKGEGGKKKVLQFKDVEGEELRQIWVESIEKWRESVNLQEPFYLAGHSLGGYLATSYSLQYPERVKHLVLAAPVGVAPWTRRKTNAPTIEQVEDEVETQLKHEPHNERAERVERVERGRPDKDTKKTEEGEKKVSEEERSYFARLVEYLLWEKQVTPQALIRSILPYSPVGPFTSSLWSYLGEKVGYRGLDKDAWEYLFQLQLNDASGDVAFFRLLREYGWSDPLYPHLPKLKNPLLLVYGSQDYIRPESGKEILDKINGAVPTDLIVLPAGHHLYWEMSSAFNKAVINLIQKK